MMLYATTGQGWKDFRPCPVVAGTTSSLCRDGRRGDGRRRDRAVLDGEAGRRARLDHASQDGVGEGVVDVALDRAPQRTRPVLLVVPFLDQEGAHAVVDLQADALLGQPGLDVAQQQVDDLPQVLAAERA